MIKNKWDNYVIPSKTACLMHVNPKFYTKCPLGIHNHANTSHQLQMEPNLVTPLRCQHRALNGPVYVDVLRKF